MAKYWDSFLSYCKDEVLSEVLRSWGSNEDLLLIVK